MHFTSPLSQATEVNDSSKVATATVYITVVDNNDNLPQFDQDFYTANVSELESTGRTVLTVSAEDDDAVSILQLGIVYWKYTTVRDSILEVYLQLGIVYWKYTTVRDSILEVY